METHTEITLEPPMAQAISIEPCQVALRADLVERTRSNAGTALEPEALAVLLELKKTNPAQFESLRSKLKVAGCRVTVLDEHLAELSGDKPERETQTAKLLALAKDLELYHTADNTGFADVFVESHRECMAIRSERFESWMRKRYYQEHSSAPAREALGSVIATLNAKSQFEGKERNVFIRIGKHDDKIYLDLTNNEWSVVEIDAHGWRVVYNPEIRFMRSAHAMPIPTPIPDGSIDKLKNFLNLSTKDDFVLLVSWMLACLRPTGPYPVLVLSGEQGAAKSTCARLLKAMLDPNKASLCNLPQDDRDLFISAALGHVLAFDNVSEISSKTSDALCRLTTGGSFSTRMLYSNNSLQVFTVQKPIIINGIGQIVVRHDLSDRAVTLHLAPIPEDKRRSEHELMKEYNAECPAILGALLDGVARGLATLPTLKPTKLTRMADFETWVLACEPTFWQPGTFRDAYSKSRWEAAEDAIDGDPLAEAVRTLLAGTPTWKGTATDLLAALLAIPAQMPGRSGGLPNTAASLGNVLRRAEPSLRKIGITVWRERKGNSRQRMIEITLASAFLADHESDTAPSAPSVPLLAEVGTANANHPSVTLFTHPITQPKEMAPAGGNHSAELSANKFSRDQRGQSGQQIFGSKPMMKDAA